FDGPRPSRPCPSLASGRVKSFGRRVDNRKESGEFDGGGGADRDARGREGRLPIGPRIGPLGIDGSEGREVEAIQRSPPGSSLNGRRDRENSHGRLYRISLGCRPAGSPPFTRRPSGEDRHDEN